MILISITRLLKSAVTENLELKLIAFLIAVLLVFLVTFQEESERFIDVEIVWQPPDSTSALIMTSNPPDTVRVRLRGPTPTVNSLKQGVIPPVNVDLSGMKEGTSVYHFVENNFILPPRCQFLSVTPASAQIRMERIVSRLLPIHVRTFGRLKYGTEMSERPQTNPVKLAAMGAASAMRGLDLLETEDVEIEGLGVGEHVFIVPAVQVEGIRIRNGDEIKVTITVDWIPGDRTFSSVPIHCGNSKQNLTCRPAKVDVTIRGPEVALDKLEKDQIKPDLRLSDEQLSKPNTYAAEINVGGLPGGFRAIEIEPEEILVTVPALPREPAKKLRRSRKKR